MFSKSQDTAISMPYLLVEEDSDRGHLRVPVLHVVFSTANRTQFLIFPIPRCDQLKWKKTSRPIDLIVYDPSHESVIFVKDPTGRF